MELKPVRLLSLLILLCSPLALVLSTHSSDSRYGYGDRRYEPEVSPGHPALPHRDSQYNTGQPFSPSRAGQQSPPGHLPSIHPEQRPTSDRHPVNSYPETSSSTEPQPPPSHLNCKVGNVLNGAVPKGKVKVDNIEGIGSPTTKMSDQECVAQCCRLGPLRCQYAWNFEGRCFAVACSAHPQLCLPMELRNENGLPVNSLYVEMVYKEERPSTQLPQYQRPEQTTTQPPNSTVSDESSTPATNPAFTSETATESTQAETPRTEPTTHPDDSESTRPEETVEPVTHSVTTETPPTTTETPPTTSESKPTTSEIPPASETPPTTTETPPTTTETPPTTTETPPTTTATTEITAPPTTPEPSIDVQVTGSLEVTLPREEVKLFAGTWPLPDNPDDFSYKWEEISGPSQGILAGKNEKAITLTQLAPGNYILKVTVESRVDSMYGFTLVNLTVHPKPRENRPPTAIIYPQQDVIKVELPQTSVTLDASRSEDDLDPKLLSYLWEEVKGPVRSDFTSNSASLELTDLKEGDYQFKVTVTDSDGAKSEALANIKVEPEVDNPPTANAGQWITIHLPNDEVTLNGSKSTDDKGIVEYSWKLLNAESDQGVDMQGSHTPTPQVSHLTLGVYTFELTVTDKAGQSDSATVSVTVKEEEWIPPVAAAGGNVTVTFPETSALLDGSKSHDDYKIDSFLWQQISGPTDISLSGESTQALSVSGLHIDAAVGSPTVYQFLLTVVDYQGLNDTDVATVIYRKDEEHPPGVDGGPNITITLPQNTAILNGSGCDDFGISSYQWTRSDSSPAAGEAVNGSDTQPVLILSNLINGTYNYSLTVTNSKGKTATDYVTLTVLPNPSEPFMIQVYLDRDISTFTKDDLEDFKEVLNLILKESSKENYVITFQGVRPHGPYVMVEFYAKNFKGELLNATEAYDRLTQKGQDYTLMSFHIVTVEMKKCQLSCSNHGTCHPRTKKCQCNAFWMENPFKANFNKRESNCEWSVFYVVLVVLGTVLVLVFLLWLCCCCCLKKRRGARTKRRMRYAILDHKDPDEHLQMLPRDSSGYQQTSLMVSESETEEEILFDSSRKSNSSPALRNGKSPRPGSRSGSLANGIIPK